MSSQAITRVDLFDGETFSRDRTVLVRDGTIALVGSDIELPKGLPSIDGSGCTLLPGLIDSHVHIEGESSLRQSLVFGATTVIDMFCDIREVAGLRKLASNDEADFADFLTAGTLATAPAGHGTEYGLTIPTLSGPMEADSFVEDRLSEGSDFIKIVYDDGVAFGKPYPTIDKATMCAVIGAAHARGRKAVVHVLSEKFAIDALGCTADGLVHLFIDRPPTPEFEVLLLEQKAFVIPTLSVLESACGIAGGGTLLDGGVLDQFLSEPSRANLKKPFKPRESASADYAVPRSTVGVLVRIGATILAGTDAPNPGTTFGASLHRELELLVDAGMTPTEALASATSVPARVFGLDDLGWISPGYRADMLMVRGNPTETIKDTRRIEAVWKRGRLVIRNPVS